MILAKNLRKDVLVPEAVLEADEYRAGLGQMDHGKRGLAGRCSLALHQNDIGMPDLRHIMLDSDLLGSFTATPYNAKTVPSDRLEMLAIGIDERHLKPAIGQNGTEKGAHPTGADHRHMPHVCVHRTSPVAILELVP